MKTPEKHVWFRARKSGWGLPSAWQGWLALVLTLRLGFAAFSISTAHARLAGDLTDSPSPSLQVQGRGTPLAMRKRLTRSETFLTLIILLAFPAFVIWVSKRPEAMLANWASQHGFELLESEGRLAFKGPYSGRSRGQPVFRVIVREHDGRQRSGWVCCGDSCSGLGHQCSCWPWRRCSCSGLFSDKVEVTWDPIGEQRHLPDEVAGGKPCVCCNKLIANDSTICPFCAWTQPKLVAVSDSLYPSVCGTEQVR
jgi:hypothetical protein